MMVLAADFFEPSDSQPDTPMIAPYWLMSAEGYADL